MALSFSAVVKFYQDEMKNLPFVPKEYFGRNVVRTNGLPTKLLSKGMPEDDHSLR
jgi:hypothetical protein